MIDEVIDLEPREGSTVEIMGFLGAVAWDKDFRVKRMALFTRRATYEIDLDESTAPLAGFVSKPMVLKGTVRRNQRGMKSLEVVDFWPAPRQAELASSSRRSAPQPRRQAGASEYEPTQADLDEFTDLDEDDGEFEDDELEEFGQLDVPRPRPSRAGSRGPRPAPM